MSRKIDIPKDVLSRLCDEGLSISQIAKRINISTSVVQKRLKDYGLATNVPHKFGHRKSVRQYNEMALNSTEMQEFDGIR